MSLVDLPTPLHAPVAAAVDAFLLAVHREQAVYGGRIRDLLVEHHPGVVSDGHDLLRRLHDAEVLLPLFPHPGVLAHAPERDKQLYRSAMAFQGLQYRDPPVALARACAEAGRRPSAGSHEFYTWVAGPAFPRETIKARVCGPAVANDGLVWCSNHGGRVREIEDCRGEAYCFVCDSERVPVDRNGRLARHRCKPE